jgi:Cu2+-exporting ATPase
LGADDFYRYRDVSDFTKLTSPAQVTNQAFLYMDDSFFQQSHVTVNKNSHEVTFQLQGVYCAGCVWLLEKMPEFLPGVLKVSINLASATMCVHYNASQVLLSDIARLSDRLGYTPHIFSPSSSMQVRQGELKELLKRLGVAAFCAGNIMLVAVPLYQGEITGIEDSFYLLFRWSSFLLFLPVLFYAATPFFRNAFRGLWIGHLHFDLPIAVSLIIGTLFGVLNLLLGTGELYWDSLAMVILLLLAGRYGLRRGLYIIHERTQVAAHGLPLWARVKRSNVFKEVPVSVLQINDLVEVLPGEVVPVDGVIVGGESLLNIAVLTGESLPVKAVIDTEVFAGSLNVSAPLVIRVIAWGNASRYGRIVEGLTRDVDSNEISRVVDLAARYFSLTILIVSLLTFIFCLPLGIGESVDRVLAISVIACPCALGLAIPATLSFAISHLVTRKGIYVRDVAKFLQLSKAREVHFDKTGTLTLAQLAISKVEFLNNKYSVQIPAIVTRLAGATPFHPVSGALLRHFDGYSCLDDGDMQTRLCAGRGVLCNSGGAIWRLGSSKWLEEEGVHFNQVTTDTTAVFLARDLEVMMAVYFVGDLHPDSCELVSWLQQSGYRVRVLSGDRHEVVQRVASTLGITPDDAFGGLYPEDKEAVLKKANQPSVMIGDGINDCAALRAADVGIAMGEGIHLLLDRAEIVISEHKPLLIRTLITSSGRVFKSIYRGLAISLAYNVIGVVFAAGGWIDALLAALLMPISSSVVLLYAYISTSKSIGRD